MNPYEVLGVSPDADEETIKKAYRELVKKYHPDKYVNSPMADVASEKMKEVNRAYDMITKGGANTSNGGGYGGYNPYGQRGYGGYGGYNPFGQSGYGGYGNYNTNFNEASFQNVRTLINMSRLNEAQNMLYKLQKTAEWYYLYGIINMRRGYYDSAVENIERAVNMDPNNVEYQSMLNNIKNRGRVYRNSPYGTGGFCNMPCDCCTMMMCANCLTPCTPCC